MQLNAIKLSHDQEEADNKEEEEPNDEEEEDSLSLEAGQEGPGTVCDWFLSSHHITKKKQMTLSHDQEEAKPLQKKRTHRVWKLVRKVQAQHATGLKAPTPCHITQRIPTYKRQMSISKGSIDRCPLPTST